MRKIRDKDYDNYRRAALAAVADQKSALIAGYIAGLGLFASILGCYLVLLLLMALMGTLLSLPTLHEVASRTTQVVGLTGGSFRVFQGLLSFAMLTSRCFLRQPAPGSQSSEDLELPIWQGLHSLFFAGVLFNCSVYRVLVTASNDNHTNNR